jgi:HD superfamily phosphohydrolase
VIDVNRSWSRVAAAIHDSGRLPAAHNLTHVLFNMIEEYTLHNGHADLIREPVDGVVGHDLAG